MAVTKPPMGDSGFERIGPYRVERRLGRGGMGEIWAGYDERLDRPVALKRVRPDAQDPERARRRFRREARAAARLHHPAIVPVHDWVESDDGDWIVMQYVEGRSLRQLLAEGPMGPERASRLARGLLDGLAAAHEAGIVHRDLKAENVMVVAAAKSGKGGEQVKILDFGLAKRYEPADSESQISAERGVVGTWAAMSPEQVLGRRVGPRSDLFSLGSLLYEMTTGVAPFQGESGAATLHRICTFKPAPARQLNPAVPEALSAFIDRLLEKDPRRRPESAEQALAELEGALARGEAPWPTVPAPDPRSGETQLSQPVGDTPTPRRRVLAWAGAAALLLALVLVAVRWRAEPKIYVVVPETRISAPPAEEPGAGRNLELMATAVNTAVLRALLGFRDVAVLEPSAEEADLDDPVALTRATAADEVVTSRVECGELTCQVVLRRLRGDDGRLLWTRSITTAPEDQLLEVGLAVVEHLRDAYPDRKLRRGMPDLEVRPEDYEAFLDIRRRFKSRESGLSTDALVAELESLERTSPRYLAVPVFKAFFLARRFQEQRDPEDLERAERAVARASELAPMDPRTLGGRAHVAAVAGRLEEAQAALEALGRVEPGHDYVEVQMAKLLARQGKAEEALVLMRAVVRRRPSAQHLFDLADMYSRQGDTKAARVVLEESLERFPESYSGLSRLAQLELLSGSPEHAAELYERLVGRVAETTELTNLGTAHLLLGNYARAVRRFRQAAELSPDSPLVTLNLADAELLRGQKEAASALYQKVLEQIDHDPRPEALQSVRAQALAHLDRDGDAVAAIQNALRLEPDRPWVAYEAALVYALVGDRTSALWNGRRALDGGVERRWFAFAWFDSIRQELSEIPTAQ